MPLLVAVSERGGAVIGKYQWRMPAMCDNCPFASRGKGLFLRRTLRAGRWREILRGLRNDGHFTCHKTTRETGDGSMKVCAGAIAWQEKHRCVGQLQRIMQRTELSAKWRRSA